MIDAEGVELLIRSLPGEAPDDDRDAAVRVALRRMRADPSLAQAEEADWAEEAETPRSASEQAAQGTESVARADSQEMLETLSTVLENQRHENMYAELDVRGRKLDLLEKAMRVGQHFNVPLSSQHREMAQDGRRGIS